MPESHPYLDRFHAFLGAPIRYRGRALLALLVIPLLLSFTQPLWRISMEAPQYPEGLHIDIYAYKLGGGHEGHDIAEINELNHYIGMQPIERAQMNDLDWIPFVFGALALLVLRGAVVGNVRSLVDLCVLITYVTLFALARFAYKLYSFGHYLDPRAPFHVDPFMPAMLGSKVVGNFTTHSWPMAGTLLVGAFAVGVVSLTVWHLYAGYVEAWRKPG
jgi:hypothetical protein